MRNAPVIGLLAGLICSAAVGAPLPARPEPQLPKGVSHVTLPEGAVTFQLVRAAEGSLIGVQATGVRLTAQRVFLWDKGNVIEIAAEKEDMRFTSPSGTSSYFGGPFVFKGGTLVIGPSCDGGRDRLRAGDTVLTHPKLRIMVKNAE